MSPGLSLLSLTEMARHAGPRDPNQWSEAVMKVRTVA